MRLNIPRAAAVLGLAGLALQLSPPLEDAIASSDVPASASAPKCTPSPPALAASFAPPASLAPAAAPAEVVGSLDEVLGAIPPSVDLIIEGTPSPVGIEAANAWLTKTYKGRKIALGMRLESLLATTAGGYSCQANGSPQAILCHHDAITSHVVALFRAGAAAPLGRVQRNSDCNLCGAVLGAAFTARNGVVTFTLAIGDAQVGTLTPAAPRPPALAAAADGSTIQTLIAGEWLFEAPRSHVVCVSQFAKDGAWMSPATKLRGTWKIENNALHLAVPELAAASPAVFELPAQSKRWQGVGADGTAVFLSTGVPEQKGQVADTGVEAQSYFGSHRP